MTCPVCAGSACVVAVVTRPTTDSGERVRVLFGHEAEASIAFDLTRAAARDFGIMLMKAAKEGA